MYVLGGKNVSPNITHKIRKFMSYLVPAENPHRQGEHASSTQKGLRLESLQLLLVFLFFVFIIFLGLNFLMDYLLFNMGSRLLFTFILFQNIQ